jgi:hypothetical protein
MARKNSSLRMPFPRGSIRAPAKGIALIGSSACKEQSLPQCLYTLRATCIPVEVFVNWFELVRNLRNRSEEQLVDSV